MAYGERRERRGSMREENESRGTRKGMKKQMERREEYREKGAKEGRMSDMRDESMFGFPKNCVVAQYPKTTMYNQASGADDWDIAGQDMEIDSNISGLNKNKTRWRF